MALTAMQEDVRNAPGSPGDLPLERIEAELTELAGHLAAGECRWLLLVAEFDRRAGWEQWGCRSCVQWLSWQCGLDGRAAREKLRVAHALDSLPVITREFAAGRLSYSKVRALTRIATAGNEAELADLATHATAVQVERIVRGYRRAGSADDERESAERAHAERWVRIEPADDGTYEIAGRLPAEVAALVLAALDAAREQDAAGRAGTGPAGPPESTGARNADALGRMAESFLATGPAARKGGDRHLVVVNVDAAALTGDAAARRCDIDGDAIAAETARRLMCDASLTFVLRGEDGRVVDVSDRARTIAPALRRAVHLRDQGCRFPGCGERSFVDVHHVRHRAHGGRNSLANLVELCWHHHRLVHEGGWTLRFDVGHHLVAVDPHGEPLPEAPRPNGSVDGLRCHSRRGGASVDASTAVARWHGDHLDLQHVIDALGCIHRRAS